MGKEICKWGRDGLGLKDAPCVQPGTILLVESLDVLAVPGAEETEQRMRLHAVSAFNPVNGFMYLPQEMPMRIPVFRKARKVMAFQELLLAQEMQARELHQPLQMLVQLLSAATARQRRMQLVHRVHQNAMLVVHGLHTDGAGMAPAKKSHTGLH